MNKLNAYEVLDMPLTGKGNPILLPCNDIPKRLIPFDKALSTVKQDAYVHFYLEDYQFERVWSKPKKYVDLLSKFDGVLMPDFSVYLDMPVPMQKWNMYRNKFIARFFQDHGVNVIPIVQIVMPSLFEDMIDGLPQNSILAVNCSNMVNRYLAKRLLRNEMFQVKERLCPTHILCYGINDALSDFDNTICYENERFNRLRNVSPKTNAPR